MENLQPKCVVCGVELPGSPSHRRYCSRRCKGRYQRTIGFGKADDGHNCRMCGEWFPIGPGQYNKWLCSDECRKASNAKSVREFHSRRPQQEAIYRARTKEKRYPDNGFVRLYRANPNAPRACEACGESRVLDVAHKPDARRNGARRTLQNSRWPQDIWILCPTCHALHDRMNYTPEELGLKP